MNNLKVSLPPRKRVGASAIVLVVVFLSVMAAVQFATNQLARDNRKSLRVLESRFACLDLAERVFHRALAPTQIESIFNTSSHLEALKTAFQTATLNPSGGYSLTAFEAVIPAGDLEVSLQEGESIEDISVKIPRYEFEVDPDGAASTNHGILSLEASIETKTRGNLVRFFFHCESKFAFHQEFLSDGSPTVRIETFPGSEVLVWQRE